MLRRQNSPADASRFVVVGLGNPGKQYANTLHNVGQLAVELLASRTSSNLKAGKDRALVAETRVSGAPTVLAVPVTYMNDSGAAVSAIVRRFRLDDLSRLVIVHDELDLEPGSVRVKVGGGLAGHNGLRSINQHLKTADFVRVRIGVGKPHSKEQGADHVLSPMTAAARKAMDVNIAVAADAVEAVIAHGALAAMTEFNGK
jgi:PTH1 family peptidyl-tRNA hydrolase